MVNKFFIYLLVLFALPTLVMAKYCVQASSVKATHKSFILRQMHLEILKNEADVRVEKTGKYLSLRIGNFDTKEDSKGLLQRVKKAFPDAFIRECSYRPESIVYSLKKSAFEYKRSALPYKTTLHVESPIEYLAPNYEN